MCILRQRCSCMHERFDTQPGTFPDRLTAPPVTSCQHATPPTFPPFQPSKPAHHHCSHLESQWPTSVPLISPFMRCRRVLDGPALEGQRPGVRAGRRAAGALHLHRQHRPPLPHVRLPARAPCLLSGCAWCMPCVRAGSTNLCRVRVLSCWVATPRIDIRADSTSHLCHVFNFAMRALAVAPLFART